MEGSVWGLDISLTTEMRVILLDILGQWRNYFTQISRVKMFAVCILKDHIKSVLRISSAHNKGGPTDINIAQILHLSNFFELKRTLVDIHL